MRALAVTLQRNEGPFLLEWIAHHLGAGFTDILIFSNDCEDGGDHLLDLLHKAGAVHHIRQTVPEGKSAQWHALKTAWQQPIRKSADWVLVSDIDEFISIKTPAYDLASLEAALPEPVDAVALPWRLFGSNHVVHFEDAPVTEQFTASAEEACPFPVTATFFKTLFRPQAFRGLGVHRPKQRQNETPRWCDGSGHTMPASFVSAQQRLSLYGLPSGRDLVECNHYSLRSAESFLVKQARGLPNRSSKRIDLAYWVERNFNTVENRSIASMQPATARHLSALHAIPGVLDAHRASVVWHRAKIDELLRSEMGHKLFGHLLLAVESASPGDNMAARMVALYQDVLKGRG